MTSSNSVRTPFLVAWILVASCGGTQSVPDPVELSVFNAGLTQYPGATWLAVDRPEDFGWSEHHLAEAEGLFDRLDSSAVMIVHRGVLIAGWGATADRTNGQSIRKSLLSALLGIEEDRGHLDINATLKELAFDDSSSPLRQSEKQARVVDLLRSSSGIYLPAIYEAGSWKRRKPSRGSHAPGKHWYYNNWSFNALGTIFEQVSGTSIHRAFSEQIAKRIGMEDFREKDVHYLTRKSFTERIMKNDSEHRAYIFMVSARDLARFGLLYLNNGRWGQQQIVPEGWVRRSTLGDTVFTHKLTGNERYGYMWWVSPPDSRFGGAIGEVSYRASGGRGHEVFIVPGLDLVVVHRLATGGVGLFSQLRRRFLGAPAVSDKNIAELMRRIVAAHPDR